MVATFAVVLPMLVLVGIATSGMIGRDQGLTSTIDQERAFLAAESGVDAAIYRARVNLLSADTGFAADLGKATRYDAVPESWGNDGVDNDGDGSIDEEDEQLVVVHVEGRYRNARASLSASFGFVSGKLAPFDIPSPVYFDASEDVKLKIKSKKEDEGIVISGLDRNLDGTRPASPVDVPAVTVSNSKVADKVEDKLKKGMQFIEGVGMVEVRDSSLDIDKLTDHVTKKAQNWLDEKGERKIDKKSSAGYGDSSAGDYQLTFATGKVEIKGDFVGAGVLIVDGEFKVDGNFRFDGLVIVRGKAEFKKKGGTQLNGALIVRGKKLDKKTGLWEKAEAKFEQNSTIQYSTEALQAASALIPNGLLPKPKVGRTTTLGFVSWRGNYARSGHVANADKTSNGNKNGHAKRELRVPNGQARVK